jgi:hypothetical protein
MTKFLVLLISVLALSLGACAARVEQDASPSPGTFGAPCGFDSTGIDRGQCNTGLECFGVCTFECGEKYSAAGDYGLDVASVDRCASHGGTCEQYAPTVQINVCSSVGVVVVRP